MAEGRWSGYWTCEVCESLVLKTQLQCCEGNTLPWSNTMPDTKIDPDAAVEQPERDYAAMAMATNQLFMRRFGRQAPGHSEPMETSLDSNDSVNVAQFKEWADSGQRIGDALEYIYKLMRDVENREEKIDDLETEAIRSKALVEAAREMAKVMEERLQRIWMSQILVKGGAWWVCLYCEGKAPEWRDIIHQRRSPTDLEVCPHHTSTAALLTLEALLPTKEG